MHYKRGRQRLAQQPAGAATGPAGALASLAAQVAAAVAAVMAGQPLGKQARAPLVSSTAQQRRCEWKCLVCARLNFLDRAACRGCGETRVGAEEVVGPSGAVLKARRPAGPSPPAAAAAPAKAQAPATAPLASASAAPPAEHGATRSTTHPVGEWRPQVCRRATEIGGRATQP